jgi:hypothetical protein
MLVIEVHSFVLRCAHHWLMSRVDVGNQPHDDEDCRPVLAANSGLRCNSIQFPAIRFSRILASRAAVHFIQQQPYH